MNSFDLATQFLAPLDSKSPLFPWKKKAWDRFLEIGLPKRGSELFQYVTTSRLKLPEQWETGTLGLRKVPQGVVLESLEKALKPFGVFLQNRLSRSCKEEIDPLALLAQSTESASIFLYVPPQVHLEIPLELVGTAAFAQVYLYVGKNSSVKIVQTRPLVPFYSGLFDAVVDADGELFFYDKAGCSQDGLTFQAVRATVKQNGRFFYTALAEGAHLSRSSLKVELIEEGADATLQGLTKLDETLEHHVHALVEHKAVSCRSRQHFKTVLEGQSVASFEGKIYVHPVAQKTEGYQLSQTLLLSESAKMRTRPNLEIFADDVKASHGATIGQLDAEALFYLRSRGLCLEEAKRFLIEGFCREIEEFFPR